jgi:hypothetical protein
MLPRPTGGTRDSPAIATPDRSDNAKEPYISPARANRASGCSTSGSPRTQPAGSATNSCRSLRRSASRKRRKSTRHTHSYRPKPDPTQVLSPRLRRVRSRFTSVDHARRRLPREGARRRDGQPGQATKHQAVTLVRVQLLDRHGEELQRHERDRWAPRARSGNVPFSRMVKLGFGSEADRDEASRDSAGARTRRRLGGRS